MPSGSQFFVIAKLSVIVSTACSVIPMVEVTSRDFELGGIIDSNTELRISTQWQKQSRFLI